MAEAISWPNLPEIATGDPQADVKKALYQARLDALKAEHQAEIDRETARIAAERQRQIDQAKADHQAEVDRDTARIAAERQKVADREKAYQANDYALGQAIYNAYIDVAKGQIDRTRASADFVQKAAAAIGSIYTGVVALTFAIDKGAPLPARGIGPAVFMGVAIVLSTAFLAYLTHPQDVAEQAAATIPLRQRADRDTLIRYTQVGALQRMYLLQTAVISLGVGVLLLPLPYLAFQDVRLIVVGAVITISTGLQVVLITLVGLCVTFLTPLLISVLLKKTH